MEAKIYGKDSQNNSQIERKESNQKSDRMQIGKKKRKMCPTRENKRGDNEKKLIYAINKNSNGHNGIYLSRKFINK